MITKRECELEIEVLQTKCQLINAQCIILEKEFIAAQHRIGKLQRQLDADRKSNENI